MRITTTTVVITAAIWILGNVALPLIVNAVERLYQSEIDRAVSGTMAGVAIAGSWLVRVVFIVYFLPAIILLWILRRAVGEARFASMRKRFPVRDLYYAVTVLTGPEWRQRFFSRSAWRIRSQTREQQKL